MKECELSCLTAHKFYNAYDVHDMFNFLDYFPV